MLDLITRAASLAPTTADPATRTVRATISTGAAVPSRDAAGPFLEVLDLNGANPADLVGVPVLDRHRQDSVDRVLGVVTAAGRDAAGIWADLQISARAEGIWQDVLSGVLKATSVGYSILSWREGRTAAGTRTKTATSWKILEVSLVPIPADAAATIRAKVVTMPDDIAAAHAADAATSTSTTADTGTRAAVPSADHDASAIANRGAVNVQIRAMCRTAGLDATTADNLIDAGATLDGARAAVFDAMLQRSTGRPLATTQVLTDHDDPTSVVDRMATAYAARATAHLPEAHRVAMPEHARAYAGRSLLDLAAELADRRGSPIGNRHLSPSEMYQRALTTSDFPILLANSANKTLLPAYQAAAPSYRRFFSRRDFRDFKPASFARVGDFPVPLAVGENGEYRHGAIAESGESVTLGEYGRIVMFSRRSLINDDLGAFADLPTKAALRCADWENAMAWALVVSNPTLSDGKALFHADHGNLAGSGAVISLVTISAGEAAMMKQTSLDGLKLNLHPAVLATGPDQFTAARQFTSTAVAPTTQAAVNPLAGKLDPVGDANIPGPGWYLLAEPTALETFIYGYLQGQSGPVITPEASFDSAGVKMKLTIDFAVGAVDYRGAYANSGA